MNTAAYEEAHDILATETGLPPGAVEVNGKPYMTDAKGALVPLEQVKAQHRLEDEVVRKVVGYAEPLSAQRRRRLGGRVDRRGDGVTQLTDRDLVEISEAVVLAPLHPAAISTFEAELIGEVGARFRDYGRDAVITAAERPVLADAARALRAAEVAAGERGEALRRTVFLARTRAA